MEQDLEVWETVNLFLINTYQGKFSFIKLLRRVLISRYITEIDTHTVKYLFPDLINEMITIEYIKFSYI